MPLTQVSAAHTFVDLATFCEIESWLYGGLDAISHFIAAIQKANWFSYIPISLRNCGTFDFGFKQVSATLNRSGDYVMHIWFTCQIPQLELFTDGTIFRDATIRWTRNFMHNLIENVSVLFNELLIEEFDNFFLDGNYQFRLRGSKRLGYRNMIGDIPEMNSTVGVSTLAAPAPLGTGGFFSVPLPFFFTEDSGIALPIAALPFNEIRVNYSFRRWQDLIILFPGTLAVGGGGGAGTGRSATLQDIRVFQSASTPIALLHPETWAHYAVVHNDERIRMGDAPRDILITQVQSTQPTNFRDLSSRASFDLRFSHAVKVLMWFAQNISISLVNGGANGSEWSNYTTEPAYVGLDPISESHLIYESSVRLSQRSDYYSLMHPYLMSDAIPEETGYHMWSYSLHPWDPLMPAGSTNYSKLANVSLQHDMSLAAQNAAGTSGAAPVGRNGVALQWPVAGVQAAFAQTFRHVVRAVNWNIVRVANGTLGLPVL